MIPLLAMLDSTGSPHTVIAYTEEDQLLAFKWLMTWAKAVEDAQQQPLTDGGSNGR